MRKRFTAKEVVSCILIAIIAICALGMICEYNSDVVKHIAFYYLGLVVVGSTCAFLLWFIQDIPKAIKVIKAIATVVADEIKRYAKMVVGTFVFLNWCRKKHKPLKWVIKRYIRLLKGE